MAPHSRPPLTSRIRASFEGRRKSFDGIRFDGIRRVSRSSRPPSAHENDTAVLSPTSIDSPSHNNGLHFSHDQNSIRDAVDAAINGEAFQNAIAANLAKLIKPSIKSALDTIQPVVEAVYSHEVLLRKTNQSVEDVLSRMDSSFVDSSYSPPGEAAEEGKSADAVTILREPDMNIWRGLLEEHSAKSGEKLAGLETIMEGNTEKVGELVTGVQNMNSSLPSAENIESLRTTSENTHTAISAMQAQLDQVKADIASMLESIGPDLGKNVQTISEKPAPDDSILASHTTKLDLISTELSGLKSQIESNTTEKIDTISTELLSLKSLVETNSTSSSESLTNILTAVTEHTAIISELKDAPAHPDILSALQQSNDSHTAHSTVLTEIKERSLVPAPPADPDAVSPVVSVPDHGPALQEIKSDLEALKENILARISSNNNNITAVGGKVDAFIEGPNSEILAAVKSSNESHEKHTTVLDEIKELHGTHATALEAVKSASEGAAPAAATADLGTQITALAGKLDEHSAAFDELKGLHGSHSTALESIKSASAEAAPVVDTGDLGEKITGIFSKLDEHSIALEEIKGLHGTQTAAIEGLKSVPSEAPPDGDAGAIGEKISGIVSKLDEHSAAFEELKGLHRAHSEALVGIKSTEPAGETGDLGEKISALASKLEEHSAAFEELKGLHGAYTAALEGIKSITSDTAPTDNGDLAVQNTALTAKLGEHSAAFEELKGLHGTHSAALESIKATEPEAAPMPADTGDIGAQIAPLISKLDEHSAILGEIKGSHTAAFDELKGLHTAHSAALDGIKSIDPATAPADGSDVGAQITALSAKLDEHSAILVEIKGSHTAAFEELKGLHGSQATALESTRSIDPETVTAQDGDIGAQISALAAKLDQHSIAFDEVRSFHGSHTAAFDELKGLHSSHSEALASIKISETVPAHSSDIGAQITALAAKLDEHSATFEELKGLHGAHSAALDGIKDLQSSYSAALENIKSSSSDAPADSSDVGAQITALNAKLDEHSVALGEIKGLGGSNTAAFDELKALHASHTTAFDDLKSLHGLHAIAFDDLKSLHGLHAAALDEIPKSAITPAPPEGGNADIGPQVAAMVAKLEEHSAILDEIKGFSAHLDEIKTFGGSHTAAFDELKGLHAYHIKALETIKTDNPETTQGAGPSDLGPQITDIIAKLDAHGISLDELKAFGASHTSALESHGTNIESIKSLGVTAPTGDSSATLETQIAAINAALEGHGTALNDIKLQSSVLEEIKSIAGTHATALEGHGAALDNIKSLSVAPPAEGSNAGLPEIVTKLDAHSVILDELKAQSAVLDEIKTSTVVLDELKAQSTVLDEIKISTVVLDELKAQSAVLDEIKTSTVVLDELKAQSTVLEELKTNTGAHLTALEGHGVTLEGTKSLSVTPPADGSSPVELESKISAIIGTLETHSSVLDEIKSSGGAHSSILDEIKSTGASQSSALEELKTSQNSHAAALEIHGTNLESVKSLSVASAEKDVGGLLEPKINDIAAKLDAHAMLLDEIKATEGSHSTVLDELKTSHVSHTASLENHGTALENIRSISSAPADTRASLEPQVTEIIAKLEAHSAILDELKNTGGSHTSILDEIKIAHGNHTTTLDEIKSRSLPPSPDDSTAVPPASADTEGPLKAIIETLVQHTSLLGEIKEDVSAEILTAIHDMGEAQSKHTTLLTEIKEENVSSEILTLLHEDCDAHASSAAVLNRIQVLVEGLDEKHGGVATKLEEHLGLLNAIKDSHDTHATSLEELKSRSLEPPTTRDDGLEAHFTGIVAKLEDHSVKLAAIQDSHSSHTTSLDEIKSRSLEVPAVEAPAVDMSGLEAQIAGVATKLDDHHVLLSSINDSHVSHATTLEEIKSKSLETPVAEAPVVDLSELEAQIAGVVTKLDGHHIVLTSIKDTTTAIHESHASHGAALDEIKSRSTESGLPTDGPDLGTLDEKINGVVTKLDGHTVVLNTIQDVAGALKESNTAHTAVLSEIKDAALAANEYHSSYTTSLGELKGTVASSIESHAAHSVMLGEIKDAAHTAALSEIKNVTSSLAEIHRTHAATLSEIKDATIASNEAHASHTNDFAQLKSIQSPTTASITDGPDLKALETHLTAITSTLESQKSILSSISEHSSTAHPDIISAIAESHALLEAHGPLLESIMETSTNTDILSKIDELKVLLEESKTEHGAAVKDLQTETKDSHSTLTAAIGALALGGAVGAGATALLSDNDKDDENQVLEEVRSLKALVESSATNSENAKETIQSIRSQIDINHTTITTGISTLADTLKAEIEATGSNLSGTITALDKPIDFSPLTEHLDQHSQDLKAISTQLDNLDGTLKENSGHVVGLSEGMHFNEKGIEQLKEHRGILPEVVSGDAEFETKSAVRSRKVSCSAVEPPVEEKNEDGDREMPADQDQDEPSLALESEDAIPGPENVEESLPTEEEIVPILEDEVVEKSLETEDAIPGPENVEESLPTEEESVPILEDEVVEKSLETEPVVEAEIPSEQQDAVVSPETGESQDTVTDDSDISKNLEEPVVDPETLPEAPSGDLVDENVDEPEAIGADEQDVSKDLEGPEVPCDEPVIEQLSEGQAEESIEVPQDLDSRDASPTVASDAMPQELDIPIEEPAALEQPSSEGEVTEELVPANDPPVLEGPTDPAEIQADETASQVPDAEVLPQESNAPPEEPDVADQETTEEIDSSSNPAHMDETPSLEEPCEALQIAEEPTINPVVESDASSPEKGPGASSEDPVFSDPDLGENNAEELNPVDDSPATKEFGEIPKDPNEPVIETVAETESLPKEFVDDQSKTSAQSELGEDDTERLSTIEENSEAPGDMEQASVDPTVEAGAPPLQDSEENSVDPELETVQGDSGEDLPVDHVQASELPSEQSNDLDEQVVELEVQPDTENASSTGTYLSPADPIEAPQSLNEAIADPFNETEVLSRNLVDSPGSQDGNEQNEEESLQVDNHSAYSDPIDTQVERETLATSPETIQETIDEPSPLEVIQGLRDSTEFPVDDDSISVDQKNSEIASPGEVTEPHITTPQPALEDRQVAEDSPAYDPETSDEEPELSSVQVTSGSLVQDYDEVQLIPSPASPSESRSPLDETSRPPASTMDDILTVEREIETDNHDEMPVSDQEFVQKTSHEEQLERGIDELSYEGENPSRSFDGFHNLENERDTTIPPVQGNVDVPGPPEYLADESLLPGDFNGGRSATSIQRADSDEIVADEDEQVPTDDFEGGHDLEESELVEDDECSVVLIPVQDDEHDAAVSKGTDQDHESLPLSIEHANSKEQNQLDLDATVSELSQGRIVGEETSYKPFEEEQDLSDSEMPPEAAIRPRGLPLAGLDAEPSTSPFIPSPINTSSRDAHLNSETFDDFRPTPAPSRDVNLNDEPQAAPNFDPPSFFPPTHQVFTNRNLDSGHATPLDEARSNPFDDSDNLASPSDALSPQSVLSPEVEIDAPNFEQYAPRQHQQPPYHDGFRSHESENSAPPPPFPSFPGMTPLQQHAQYSEDVLSPTSEYGSPGFQAPRVRTPVQAQHFQPPVFEDPRAETPMQGRQFEASSRDFTPEFERRAVGPSEPTGGARPMYDSDDDQPPISRRELPAFPQVQQRASVFSEQQEPAQQMYDSDDDQAPTSKRELPAFPQVQQRASVFSEQQEPAQQIYDSDDDQAPTFKRELPAFPQVQQRASVFSDSEQREPAQQMYGSEDGQSPGSEIRRPTFQQNQQRESVFPDFEQRGPAQQMYESHNDQSPDFRRELSTSSQARQNAPVQYDNDSDYAQSPELERRAPVFPSFGQQLPAQQMDEPREDQSLNFRRELSTSSQARQNAPVPYDNDSDYAQSPELERRAPVFPSFGQQLPAQQMDEPREDQSLNFRRELSTSREAQQNAPIPYDNDSEYAQSPRSEHRAPVFPSFGQPIPEQMDKPRDDQSLNFRRELSTSSQGRQNAPIQHDNNSEYAQSPRSERHAPVFPSFGQPAPEQIYDSDDDDTPDFRRELPQYSQAQQGALAPETYDFDGDQSLQRRIPVLPNFGQPVPGQHQQTYDADEDRHASLERELPAFPGLGRQQTPAGQQNYDSVDVPSTDIERRAPIFPNFGHPVPDQQIHDDRSQDFRRELPSFPGLGQGQQPSTEERTYGSSEAQSPEFERRAPVFPNFGQSATTQQMYDSDDNRSPDLRRELPAFPGLGQQPPAEGRTHSSGEAQSPELERRAPVFPNFGQPATTQQMYDSDDDRSPDLRRELPAFPGLAEGRTYGSSEAQSLDFERRVPVFPNLGQPATAQQIDDESDDEDSSRFQQNSQGFPELSSRQPLQPAYDSDGRLPDPRADIASFPDVRQQPPTQQYDSDDGGSSEDEWDQSPGFQHPGQIGATQPVGNDDLRSPELGAYRPDSTQQDLRPTSPDLRRPADDSYGGFGSEQRYDAPAFPNIGRRSRSPLRTLEADEVRSRDSETNAAARDLPTMPLRLPRRPFEEDLEDLDDQNNENDFRPRDLDAYARAPAFPDLGHQASTSSQPLDDPYAAYSREYEREEVFPDSRAHHFDEDEFRPRGLDFHQPPPPPRPLFQAQQFDTSSSSHSGLPAHLQLNVPATTPLFTDRRQRSSEHPFEDEQAASPSSEFAVPITPGLARNAAPQFQSRDFPAGPSFSDPRTEPNAGFGSREDTSFADFRGTGARVLLPLYFRREEKRCGRMREREK
ncbi:hypothetical protein LZ554_001974 [Drepanopeziza brunnea f. sp. 'monogermtubi']|nr:hypothetical protein LZ554_001974 [Drepanopeziza brunnea f. sp. 'monogermtubi']